MASMCTQIALLILLLKAPGGAPELSAPTQEPNPRRTPVVDVFEKAHSAVVNISSARTIERRIHASPFDLFFDDLHDFNSILRPRTRKFQSISVGSGFVVHPSGFIVTNAHVVDRATDVEVIFDNERRYDAELVAIDHDHDLALMKILAEAPLPVIQLGRSDDLLIGETVIAIGNPLGYQHTLTTGVISATNRDLELTNESTNERVVYEGLIQSDASINPGNSGGPLLNILGELIGINTAIRSDAQNIGFAIPVDTLKELLPEMLLNQMKSRFALGFRINDDRQVVEIWDDSQATRAGLKVGDVVNQINQTSIENISDFYFEIIRHRPGDLISLQVQRNGASRRFRIQLEEKPRPDGEKLAWQKLGMRLTPLTPQVAQQLGLRIDSGLLISELQRGGPAHAAGLQPGDILTVVGRFYVSDLDEVGQLLEDVHTGDRVYIRTLRITQNLIYYQLGAHLIAN